MVKVNYYKVKGFEEHEPKSKGIIYARSKNEAREVVKARGFKDVELDNIFELNFKSEIVKILDEKRLKEMRKQDKKFWRLIARRH